NKRARRVNQYKNPHNGEVIETKGGNHNTLKERKAKRGSDAVEDWATLLGESRRHQKPLGLPGNACFAKALLRFSNYQTLSLSGHSVPATGRHGSTIAAAARLVPDSPAPVLPSWPAQIARGCWGRPTPVTSAASDRTGATVAVLFPKDSADNCVRGNGTVIQEAADHRTVASLKYCPAPDGSWPARTAGGPAH